MAQMTSDSLPISTAKTPEIKNCKNPPRGL